MTTTDRIVPTALTHLWRKPSRRLEKGDGVIVFDAQGCRHGIVIEADDATATVRTPAGVVGPLPIDWEA